VFLFAKVLQAVGFAHVGIGLFLGIMRDDLWGELYLSLTGLAFFGVGRLIEPRK
jgi:hypothetical protein